jgi:hypothetical protein
LEALSGRGLPKHKIDEARVQHRHNPGLQVIWVVLVFSLLVFSLPVASLPVVAGEAAD